MPYSYIEHTADIGIRAVGKTLEEAFEAGAEAMLSIMFELKTINEAKSVKITATAPEIDLLFVEVLNEILSIQGRDMLALIRLERVKIKKTASGFAFTGYALGEPLDLKKHEVKTEVKGATYSGLRYSLSDSGHQLECILDV
ncbi:archease [bacterium]|nr:MAG: archease [bacterium]